MRRKRPTLVLTRYRIENEKGLWLKAAVVADLHDGDGREAVRLLRRVKPDLILMPGDILERYDRSFSSLMRDDIRRYGRANTRILERALIHIAGSVYRKFFPPKAGKGMRAIRALTRLAPVYYSPGNHESLLTKEDREMLRRFGVVFLDNAYVRCETADGVPFVVGGLSSLPETDWLPAYAACPGYHLLLCHHPEYYGRFIKKLGIELTVSGHAHGGQIRLGKRGLYAPGQGLFPKYTKGVYDGRLVVSAGLANNGMVPRLHNPTEVVLLDICGKM